MRASAKRKDHPLSLRLPAADLAVIDRAARARGRSRTEFMRDAAVSAAETVLLESALVRLSPAAFAAFMAELDARPRAHRGLVRTLRRAAPWDAAAARRP
ncbi:MAG: DUF1778 domain-containing protein [Rhodospirillaceae bacterium]|nr:DUF1778 domain-containing protein [Rhodospirillaceae bacterium]